MKSFELSDNFIKKYKSLDPGFGFNGLGEITFFRTYSRQKEGIIFGFRALFHLTVLGDPSPQPSLAEVERRQRCEVEGSKGEHDRSCAKSRAKERLSIRSLME